MARGLLHTRALALSAIALGLVAAPAHAALPDDPLLARQWQLASADVLGAPQAWAQSQGQGVVVAVLDTGARLDHPDLAPNLWTNPGEIAGNGLDDDHDGVVDDVHGADLVDGDGDPSDDEGHGTHVAGIIGARGGNAIGVTGVAPLATLMIVKVLDAHRDGTAATVAAGIRYALAHGASIINVSINGDGVSPVLQSAIAAADAAGATIVASAGNDHRVLDLLPSYPASYPDANVLGVGSVGADGTLSAFSNTGRAAVDVVAPGEDILSTARDGGYELRSGTSMAAAEVSGALALLQGAGASPAAARSALLGTLKRLPVVGTLIGGGTPDLVAALHAIVPDARWHGSSAPLGLALARPAARRAGSVLLRFTASGDVSAVAALRVTVDGEDRQLAAGTAALRLRLGSGSHLVEVHALDAAGDDIASATRRFSLTARGRA